MSRGIAEAISASAVRRRLSREAIKPWQTTPTTSTPAAPSTPVGKKITPLRRLELVRPCALLTGGGDGPVVGRFGGPVSLPSDVEDPRFPLIATIDCAALPRAATDLPLPAD